MFFKTTDAMRFSEIEFVFPRTPPLIVVFRDVRCNRDNVIYSFIPPSDNIKIKLTMH